MRLAATSAISAENDMAEINIPPKEREALKAIDTEVLRKLVGQSMDEKHSSSLRVLRLESCGLYVASSVSAFERALKEYGAAKAARKVADMEYRARRAGGDLVAAVQQMKHRVETEEKEGQFFYVEDQIMPPYRFSEHLAVRVSYRWRAAIGDQWEHGSITFTYSVDSRPDYSKAPPKRKPSASQLEQERQDALYGEWEQLTQSALQSVRDFFREGGNASAIPEKFRAVTDSYSRRLNNLSTQFWRVWS